jgi:hypothetical protein
MFVFMVGCLLVSGIEPEWSADPYARLWDEDRTSSLCQNGTGPHSNMEPTGKTFPILSDRSGARCSVTAHG